MLTAPLRSVIIVLLLVLWSTAMEDKDFVWPFPNSPLPTEPLDKLPFNPENEEDAPI